MGRKPLPDIEKKNRVVLYLTEAEERWIRELVAIGPQVRQAGDVAQPYEIRRPSATVKLPVIELADEADNYMPSMRECNICGKDYDGNLHTTCPHEHIANNPRRK